MQIGYGSQALRYVDAVGADYGLPRIRGALAGTVISAVAGRHLWRPGAPRRKAAGTLAINAGGSLTWTPDDGSSGTAVAADGSPILLTGADLGRWIETEVIPAYLPGRVKGARIDLEQRFNAMPAGDDVASGDALAGLVTTEVGYLRNDSGVILSDLRVWLDPACSEISIRGPSGSTYYRPTTEDHPDVIRYAALLPGAGAAAELWIRRTIAAGAAANPERPLILHAAWDGV